MPCARKGRDMDPTCEAVAVTLDDPGGRGSAWKGSVSAISSLDQGGPWGQSTKTHRVSPEVGSDGDSCPMRCGWGRKEGDLGEMVYGLWG